MKTAVWLDYKPTRYEGKCFLRNLNIRIHRDITGEMWFGVGCFFIHILLRLGVYAYNQNFTLIENISGIDNLSPSSFVLSKAPALFNTESSPSIPKS